MIDDIYSWIYAHGGVQYPRIFAIAMIGIGGIGGKFLASKIASTYNDSFGSIEGVISLQDGSPVKELVIEVFKDKKLSSTYLAEDGKFAIKLEKGAYSFNMNLPGYKSKTIHNIHISNGTQFQNETLEVIGKSLTLNIKDKKQNPYKTLNMSLKRNNSWDSMITLTFDVNGKAQTPHLEPDIYSLDLLNNRGTWITNEFGTNDIFLWRKFKYLDNKDLEVARFFLPGYTNTLDVILPKVVLTNTKRFSRLEGSTNPVATQGEGTGSSANFPKYTKQIQVAQSIEVKEATSFCGIGYGSFNFGSPNANKFEIREDIGGVPSTSALHSTDKILVGDFSGISNNIPYSEFCEGTTSSRILEPGKYWLIHTFQTVMASMELFGVIDPASKAQTLYSADSSDWARLPMTINEISYFIVE